MLTKIFSYQIIEIINLVITSQFFILLIIGASLRRKNIIPIIGSSLLILSRILIYGIDFFSIAISLLQYIPPIVLLIVSIIAFAKRKSKLNKFLGILPFLLYFTTELISIIVFPYMYGIPIYVNLLSNILSLIFVGGLYLLIGLLLVKNPPATAKNVAYQYTAPATPVQNAYNPQVNNYYAEPSQSAQPVQPVPPTQSIADEIIKLKSLMDQGIITPEEFEAKKKELLNI
jgi:hypothetical protein